MLKKICNLFSTAILIVLVILAVILVLPKILGWQTLAVLSGSMEPEISVGAIVIVKDTEPSELVAGDIATYRISGDTLVTHRVLENHLDEQEIVFKGDANDVPDANPVTYSDIVGKVLIHFPWIGYITIYIKTPLGVAAICGLVFVLVLLTFLPDVFESDKNVEAKPKNKK